MKDVKTRILAEAQADGWQFTPEGRQELYITEVETELGSFLLQLDLLHVQQGRLSACAFPARQVAASYFEAASDLLNRVNAQLIEGGAVLNEDAAEICFRTGADFLVSGYHDGLARHVLNACADLTMHWKPAIESLLRGEADVATAFASGS